MIGPWRHHLCIYKSLIREKLSKFSQLSFCQKLFFQNQTPSCICSMCLHYIGKVSNCSIKSCGRKWSAHKGTIYAYTKALLGKYCLSSHCCHFVKIIFSKPNSFMHMFNVSTLYRKSIKEVLALRRIFSLVDMITNTKGPVSIRPVSWPLWISFKLCVIKVVCLSCKMTKCWINRLSFLSCIFIWSGWGNSTPNRVM